MELDSGPLAVNFILIIVIIIFIVIIIIIWLEMTSICSKVIKMNL